MRREGNHSGNPERRSSHTSCISQRCTAWTNRAERGDLASVQTGRLDSFSLCPAEYCFGIDMDEKLCSRKPQLPDQPGKLLGALMGKNKVGNIYCRIVGHETGNRTDGVNAIASPRERSAGGPG